MSKAERNEMAEMERAMAAAVQRYVGGLTVRRPAKGVQA